MIKTLARLLHLSTLLIGVIGVALCVAAAVVCWRAGVRATVANRNVFQVVDTALVAGRDGVLAAQARVQQSKITTEDVRQSVDAWARRETAQRIAARPEIQNSAERLVQGLQQVDGWLTVSSTSVRSVQQALGLASSLGAPADPALVEPLLQRLDALRGRLSESSETVHAIHDGIDRVASGESLEERLSRFAQLTLRVVATLSDIDSRLGDLADRFAIARTRASDAKIRIDRYILIGQIGVVLLISWMAVGQIFLARYGWTRFRATSSYTS